MDLHFRTRSQAFTLRVTSEPKAKFKKVREQLATEVSPALASLEYHDSTGSFIDDSDTIRRLKDNPDSFIYGVEHTPSRVTVQRKLSSIHPSQPNSVFSYLSIRLTHKQEYKPRHFLPSQSQSESQAQSKHALGFESGLNTFASVGMYLAFQADWNGAIDDILNRLAYTDASLCAVIDQNQRKLAEMFGCRFVWREDDLGVFVFPETPERDLAFLLIDVGPEDLPGFLEIYCEAGYLGIEGLLAMYTECDYNLTRTRYRAMAVSRTIQNEI
jgi:hypothetical protein